MSVNQLRKEQNDKIIELKAQIGKHEGKVAEFGKRTEAIQEKIQKAQEELSKLKQEQCDAIAAGEDYFAISQDVKSKSSDVEVFENALATVLELQAKENNAIAELNKQINLCLIELDKLEAAEIVCKYNNLCIELSKVFHDYDLLAVSLGEKVPKGTMTGVDKIRKGYALLDEVVRRRKDGFSGYGRGLPFLDLVKAFVVLPGESVVLPDNTEYHFEINRDTIKL